ncbi:xylulokinase [Conservatibacter flavescens]|uniref:ATPase n=1 Tax=Conservatibacter flavescens TaxID=28161 RepID=A0A2M8S2H2_9PAST|nr:FGGY-family carbohydrate kinase [Conservatibacter flavescens]PJG85342.1 ATPase [Conservatibacter flavescens]
MKSIIQTGKASLGIELGSTRIKAVLIAPNGQIIASGGVNWENQLVDGIWTYDETAIWAGLQQAYADLVRNVQQQYDVELTQIAYLGVSAMMHGYLPFDRSGNLLVPFRTWRNNITANSSQKLTALFHYNIPQRWSIAHLYQAILNNEPHLNELDYFTTLAGYVHWQLTGEKVLGVGDASGMFPIDTVTGHFDQAMLAQFEQLVEPYAFPWRLRDILPQVKSAGENAGRLSEQGAKRLDPTGRLQAGVSCCPPEGDAGTGMVATNSIKPKTGNISAGTSAFAMIVLEQPLSNVYEELDMVTTPAGQLVAMAHSNNCTTEINSWVNLFAECLQAFGVEKTAEEIYQTLFQQALTGEADCGGLLAYGFHSGEHIVGLSSGCPLFLHPTQAHFNLANFMRVQLYTAFGAMKLGMDILMNKEQVKIEQIFAHGGIFKTQGVAQTILASALNVPIAVQDTAGEGGAWGIALLANYLGYAQQGISLEDYLEQHIFLQTLRTIQPPDPTISQGYQTFMTRYQAGLNIAKQAATVQE